MSSSNENCKTIEQTLDNIGNGKIKVPDSSLPTKEMRRLDLNKEQMDRALEFVKKVPEQWKDILPTKEYLKLPRKTDKVAIVGFANTWIKAPFKDKKFEIWGINELYKYFQAIPHGRADRWFEIHSRQSPSKSKNEHITWLQKANIPIYMWEHYDDMPGSLPYPRKEVKDKLRETINVGVDYFTNQISWMLALAWFEGFKEVHVYGVNMATDSEYGFQRPSCEFWFGFLQGQGIKVVIPQECDLCKSKGNLDYGFQTDNAQRILVKQRIADNKPKFNQINKQLDTSKYKLDEVERTLRNTEGYINGIQDAKRCTKIEELDEIMKQKRAELEELVWAEVQLVKTIESCQISLAGYRAAIDAYDDVANHIMYT